MLYEQAVVEQILGLLEGTTIYTTNAPADQTINIPDTLARKLKYSNQKDAIVPKATLQVTGILTESEKTQAKSLLAHPGWAPAIDRVGKQTKNVFNNVLFGIFPIRTGMTRSKIYWHPISTSCLTPRIPLQPTLIPLPPSGSIS